MDIGIVGGGIGGITSALLLAGRGNRVTLYEREASLGGRLSYREGQGYRIDQGPTIVLLPEMLLGLFEEAGIDRSRFELLPCDPLCLIHYADGSSLVKHRSPQRQAEEIERAFPGEGDGFRRFMRDMGSAFERGRPAILERAFLRRRDFFNWRNVKLLAGLKIHQSARAFVSRYFRDERLIDAYSLQTLYIGGAPFRTPSLYALLPYSEHAHGVWYVKGGYASMVPALHEELQRKGITVRLGADVKRLAVKDGVCIGVETALGSRHHDAVVYNGDFPHLAGLLPAEARPRRLKRYEPSSGCFLIYLGLDRRWPEASIHQFFLPESLDASLRQVFVDKKVPDAPSFYAFYPTAIDEEAAPPGESTLYLLVPAPPSGQHVDWETEGPKLAQRIVDEAERRGFPGLRKAIRWMEVRSPDDAKAEGLYGGGSFGIAPTLTQSAAFRPQLSPYPIRGLYAVGASIHPGGGIPIVMQGAKLLADHLSKEETSWISTSVSLDARR